MRPARVVLLLVSLLSAIQSLAATRTWTGTNSGSWTDPGNWGGTAPVANDDLVFPAGALNLNNTNNYPANTAFRSIVLSDVYHLFGNAVSLGVGGLSINTTTAAISFPITLAASQQWFGSGSGLNPPFVGGNVSLNGATLTLTGAPSSVQEIAGAISGTGTIVMNGPGMWFLKGANTYAGQTLINGGFLATQDASSLGVADNTLANGLIINGGALSLGGNVGNEYIRMFPGPIFDIQGGGIDDLQGTLELVSGQVVVNSDSGPVRFLGKITGNGGITFAGGGFHEVSNQANDFQGPIVVNGASVTLTADHVLPPRDMTLVQGAVDLHGTTQTIASLSGSGGGTQVKLGTGGTLNITGPATTVFAGPIEGSGTVALQGGDLTLVEEASTFTGSFINNGGTLRVLTFFAVMPAPYTQSSGTLVVSSSGTVGAVTINGGTFAPGANGVALANTGSLSLAGGTTYSELINGPAAGSFALTRVTGSVALGGAALQLSGSGAGIAPGTQFVIIDNDGSDPVVGTFNGLPEGAVIPLGPGNVNYRISYVGGTGNDVVLTAITATSVPALSHLALLALGTLLAATALIALRQ
jgi:autotransporter-associated beta strand protein